LSIFNSQLDALSSIFNRKSLVEIAEILPGKFFSAFSGRWGALKPSHSIGSLPIFLAHMRHALNRGHASERQR
jgi:hypothetical protein